MAKRNEFQVLLALMLIAALLLPACAEKKPDHFMIGVVSPASSMEPVLQGFKDGMAANGFVDGENVTYLYAGPLGPDAAKLEAEVQRFVDQKVDLILALATPATTAAKKVTAGTGVPVVFTPISDPVGAGFVDSLTHPGGNMTGIKSGGFVPKELEWLTVIQPSVRKVFAPYNPKDSAAVYGRDLLLDGAKKLGVEIVAPEVASGDDVPALLENMPADIDAIFMLSDSMILSRIADFVMVAAERKMPLTSINISQVQAGALMAYGPEFTSVGLQTASLAAQILNGADPGTLPVQEAEYVLYLNQKVADQIGITFPAQALNAAKEIVR